MKLSQKKTNRSSFQKTFIDFVPKGPNFESDVISKKRWFELYFTLRHIFKFMKNNFRCFETFSDFKEITKKITRFAPLSILKKLRRKKDFSIEKKFKNTFLGGF